MVDEGLEALRKLFSERVACFDGRFYKFRDVELSPKPLQKRLPIYVGGNNVNNIRRTVQYADGWLPAGIHVDRMRKDVQKLREMAEKAGRDPKTSRSRRNTSSISARRTRRRSRASREPDVQAPHLAEEVDAQGAGRPQARGHQPHRHVPEVVEKALAFREAGVTHFLGLYFAANTVPELLDQMQVFAEEVSPRVK